VNEQALTSFFFSGVSAAEQRDLGRVLVLGGDWIGLELAERLGRDGFQVVLLGHADIDNPPSGVTPMPTAVLEEVRGFVGDLAVVLRTPAGVVTEKVGAVVAAGPARVEANFARYGLVPSENVLSLSDMEKRLQAGNAPGTPEGVWLHVAFLYGLTEESHPAVFSRILDVLEQVSATRNAQTYVFTKNVKVAGPGLEKRFRDSRQKGTLYFKFEDDQLAIAAEKGRMTLVFPDPLLHEEMALFPDVLVVDEVMLPPASLEPLLAAIPSSPAFDPFAQPESVRFPGVETPKAGIFAVGPSRGIFAVDQIRGDMDAVVAALKRPLNERNITGWGAPQVDANKCTMCLTCVRLCPHGAMGFQERPGADPLSCVRCGICAAECPMAAITLEPPSETGRASGVGEPSLSSNGTIAAFLCARSAMDALAGVGPNLLQSVAVKPVPCAGTVSVTDILTALGNGAAGVLVAGCFKGNCASIYGTVLGAQRSGQAQRLVEEAGLPPGRVYFTSCASNAPANLTAALLELQELVKR
jgi:coenzyme F420-reducing hydrogenase delta subunit/Pyruvate/2-oxoacid:ferredoxin oxidoreductase delta subunit